MARYIDIEGAGIGKANREQFLVPEFADGWNAVLKILEKEPTDDVVEVVYCKDCEWSVERVTNNEIFPYQCLNTTACGKPRRALDFCSYGERS